MRNLLAPPIVDGATLFARVSYRLRIAWRYFLTPAVYSQRLGPVRDNRTVAMGGTVKRCALSRQTFLSRRLV